MKEHALNYLLELKVDHSKLDSLLYNKLKLQNYLKNDGIPVHESKNLFYWELLNFEDTYAVCKVQLDPQAHSVQCEKVKEEIRKQNWYF